MATIADLENAVLQRLEEDTASPKFWSVQDEIRPFLVEAMSEIALITGEPEIRRSALFTLTTNTRIFPVPTEFIALLRMEGPKFIEKVSLWELDQMVPDWEGEANADQPKAWFPIGLTRFGLYPKLTADNQVFLTGVALPVTAARPYAGTEAVQFQEEFQEGFTEYAAHVARLKEGGNEFVQSIKQYDRFLSRAEELSHFAIRKGSLRFSRAAGVPAKITDVEQR